MHKIDTCNNLLIEFDLKNSVTEDFILLTNHLKDHYNTGFSKIARAIGMTESKIRNIRRETSSASFDDLDALIKNFPKLLEINFQNKDKFQNKTSSSDDDLGEEEMKQRIAELEKENHKLIDEIAAKMEKIDFENEANRALTRTVNRLLDLLEKNERGELTEEEEKAIIKEVEEFRRNNEK